MFKVLFEDGETIIDRIGAQEFYVWGVDTRPAQTSRTSQSLRWEPVKLMRCLDSKGAGCITYYKVILCPDFTFPDWPNARPAGKRIEPVISVRTLTPDASQDLRQNYSRAHELVGTALEELFVHSCKKDINDD